MTPDNDRQAGDDKSSVWWRTRWMESIYDSDLRPNARLVAFVHADIARQNRTVWVALDELIRRTGMSRSQALSWRAELVKSGHLIRISKAVRGSSPTFALVIPGSQGSEIPDPEGSEIPDAVDSKGPEIDVQGSGNPDVRVRDSGPQQSPSNPLSISLALTANQIALQKALGCDERDERLMIADALFEAHHVRSAAAWLRTAKANGDLDDLIAKQQQEASSPWGDEYRHPAPKSWSDNPSYPEGWGPATTDAERKQKWKDRIEAIKPAEPSLWDKRFVEPPCDRSDCVGGWINVGDKVAHCPECRPARRRPA